VVVVEVGGEGEVEVRRGVEVEGGRCLWCTNGTGLGRGSLSVRQKKNASSSNNQQHLTHPRVESYLIYFRIENEIGLERYAWDSTRHRLLLWLHY
jgi:hypothetical protein